jgi:Flp pilus assembly protein TadD
MKQVLNITDKMTHSDAKALLDADAKDKQGRNQWRETQMDDAEQEWRKAMKLASRE